MGLDELEGFRPLEVLQSMFLSKTSLKVKLCDSVIQRLRVMSPLSSEEGQA